MSPLHTLLRFMLVVTFCLEGSMSLWASSAMAVDSAHQVAAAVQAPPAAADQDCEDVASSDEGGSVHRDCDCGAGSGCACACVFPVVAIAPTLPFAAQHLLATQPVVPSRAPVALAAITPVFRPPIG
ncbi:MAG: CopL family metal-binding regulatory protein [Lysobacter sp.]